MRQPHYGLQATDWEHYLFLHRKDRPKVRKSDIALKLGITPAQFSQRLDPARYDPPLSDSEVRTTARMWNQSVDYVREIFPRRAEDAA